MTRLEPRMTARLEPRLAPKPKADYGQPPTIPTARTAPREPSR